MAKAPNKPARGSAPKARATAKASSGPAAWVLIARSKARAAAAQARADAAKAKAQARSNAAKKAAATRAQNAAKAAEVAQKRAESLKVARQAAAKAAEQRRIAAWAGMSDADLRDVVRTATGSTREQVQQELARRKFVRLGGEAGATARAAAAEARAARRIARGAQPAPPGSLTLSQRATTKLAGLKKIVKGRRLATLGKWGMRGLGVLGLASLLSDAADDATRQADEDRLTKFMGATQIGDRADDGLEALLLDIESGTAGRMQTIDRAMESVGSTVDATRLDELATVLRDRQQDIAEVSMVSGPSPIEIEAQMRALMP